MLKKNNITTAEARVRFKASLFAAWSMKCQLDRFSSRAIWLDLKYHSTDEPHSFNHLIIYYRRYDMLTTDNVGNFIVGMSLCRYMS